jgi:aspartate/methionine/tyrosine aminotransferase
MGEFWAPPLMSEFELCGDWRSQEKNNEVFAAVHETARARLTAVELTRSGANVVVFRTFGKICGLAGMPMGYAVAPKGVADSLKRNGLGAAHSQKPARADSRCCQPARYWLRGPNAIESNRRAREVARIAFAHLGRDAEAREAAARLLEVDPDFTISAWIARGGQSNAKLMVEGLRKAGLPE